MIFNGPYDSSTLVPSANDKILVISEVWNGIAGFDILVDGVKLGSLSMLPNQDGEIRIQLGNLLNSISDSLSGSVLVPAGTIEQTIPVVRISSQQDPELYWEHQVLYCSRADSVKKLYNPLSTRPKVYRASFSADIPISFIGRIAYTVKCTAHFRTLPDVTVTLYSNNRLSGGFFIATCNVGYSAIINKIVAQYPEYAAERMISWTVQIAESLAETSYELVDDDSITDGFLFRNESGGLDVIYASGEKTRKMDFESDIFVRNNVSKTLRNDSCVQIEQGSGYISSEDELHYWLDFLRSKDVHLLNGSNGIIPVTIIETDVSAKHKSLNSLKFTYKYSDSAYRRANVDYRANV